MGQMMGMYGIGFKQQEQERWDRIGAIIAVAALTYISFKMGEYYQYYQPVPGMDSCQKIMGQIETIKESHGMMLPVKKWKKK